MTIETRELTEAGKAIIEINTVETLEDKYVKGDYLYMLGIAFKMVYYSVESNADGKSNNVVWWSELYNIEIQVDRVNDTIVVETPVIDWRKDGF